MTPVGAPSLEVLASWTLSPNQMHWSQSQVPGGHLSALLLAPGSQSSLLSLCMSGAPHPHSHPAGGPSLFLILWVRPPEMQQEGNEVGVADHTEGAALISEVQDQCPLEGVAGQ